MFNWFSPKCPVEPAKKLWVERVITWIIGEFGLDRLRRAPVVLPLPKFFPDPADGSQEAARSLFGRVCHYMDIDPTTVDLEFFHSPERDQDVVYVGPSRLPAGRYTGGGSRPRILIEIDYLRNPMALVAIMAHELGHVHLLWHKAVPRNLVDGEAVTDMLVICFGLGIFGANTRAGYLTTGTRGYALGLFAYLRQESNSAWIKHIRPDERAVTRQALRYLLKTKDLSFDSTSLPPHPQQS
jgi:hypothetical protein